jgi:hypothetical protein
VAVPVIEYIRLDLAFEDVLFVDNRQKFSEFYNEIKSQVI